MVSLLSISLLVIFIFYSIKMSDSGSVFLNPEAELMLRYLGDNYVLRVPASEAVTQHINLAQQASDVARQTVPHELDIRYGNREQQLLDIYGTDLPPGSSIFLYIHGGGWTAREYKKENSAYPVIPLWRSGVKVVVAEYDLAPNVTLEVMVEEIEELAVFVLEMAETENCRNVWIGGHSAGGHLAASLLQGEWYNRLNSELKGRIQGFVLISGLYNIIPYIFMPINKVLQLDRKRAVSLSPAFCQGVVKVPHPVTVLLVVAQQDSPFSHNQALEYYKVIRKQPGVNTIYLSVPGLNIDHFSIVINLQHCDYILTRNIISLVKRAEI